jgi:hypothetical protein
MSNECNTLPFLQGFLSEKTNEVLSLKIDRIAYFLIVSVFFLATLTQNTAILCRFFIITLLFEIIAVFAENLSKSPKS